VTDRSRKEFQPMNANYGLFPPLGQRMRGRDKKQALGQRALACADEWILQMGIENSERVLRTSSC